MSIILIIGARIDRLTNARRAIRQCSGLGARAARSSPRTSSADCITSISTRHNGGRFCALQAIAGGADITIVAAKMANSLDRSSELHRTYAPVDLAAVRNADEARSKGRRKMRGAKPTDSSATG
jgi:hypothetical protein